MERERGDLPEYLGRDAPERRSAAGRAAPGIVLRREHRGEPVDAREVLYGADTAPIGFSDVLHVGNSFSKDFVGARDAGMRAVLLDRFGRAAPDEESSEGKRWRAAGAAVVHDLSDVLEHVARSDFALGCHESRV